MEVFNSTAKNFQNNNVYYITLNSLIFFFPFNSIFFLEFVYEFLNSLADLCENDKTHGCCKTSYETTLAKHHPWVVRKGALVAMYALPTKGELLKRVCCNADRVTDFLPEMLKNTKVVYDRTQDLYTLYDLHQLP